jgi:DNA-binding response OmpR family regulator
LFDIQYSSECFAIAHGAILIYKRKHAVTHAADGNKAWILISSGNHGFNAVIMDLNMPGMNGMELARRVRESRHPIPLIVMSGKIAEEEQLELTRLHIDAILNKPFGIKQLEDVISRALIKTQSGS